MKPYTSVLGLISIAALATTPTFAASTLIESWENTLGNWTNTSSLTYQTDGVTIATVAFTTSFSQDYETLGDYSLKITSPAGWGQGMYITTNETAALGSTTISTAVANNPIIAMDAYADSNYLFAQLDLAFNGTMGWTQLTTVNFNPSKEQTIYWVFPSDKITALSTTTYLQLTICTGGTMVTSGTNGNLYIDNLRVFNSLWETENAWNSHTWYGDVYPYQTGDGFIWSADSMEFQYATGAIDDMWLFDYTLGWLWTSFSTYPYYYDYAQSAWVYYFVDYSTANDQRWYFVYKTNGAMGWSTDTDLATGTITEAYTAQ